MKKLIAAVVLALAAGLSNAADMFVADTPDFKMTLTDDRCAVPGIAVEIPPQMADRILHGRVELKATGEERELCYVDTGDGFYFVEDEKGTAGSIQKNQFLRMTEK